MIRAVIILLVAAFLGAPVPSAAQTAAPAAQAGLSADQARQALDVLNDPAKRAAMIATLNAIIKTQPAAASPGTSPPDSRTPDSHTTTATGSAHTPPSGAAASAAAKPAQPAAAATATSVEGLKIPLAPDSLGAQVLVSAAAFVNSLGVRAMDAIDAVQSLPLLYGWAVVMVTNPVAQDLLLDVGWRVALALACAIAVRYGVRRLMQRPIRAVEAFAPPHRIAEDVGSESEHDETETDDPACADTNGSISTETAGLTDAEAAALARAEAGDIEAPPRRARPSAWALFRRVPLVLARLLLELVPVVGIFLIGHLIAGSALGGQTVSRLIILAVIDAYVICTALLCFARMLLSPGKSRLRLFHLNDGTATYLMRWIRRLVVIAVLGYAVGEVGLLLGLSDLAHDLLEKSVGLVLHICVAIIVLQNRRPVRKWIRAPDDATGVAAAVRNRFARIWHWLALFFLAAGWIVWAIELPHGFAVLLHYFIVTSLVLTGARLTLLTLLGVIDKSMRPDTPGVHLLPGMDKRIRFYHPIVAAAVRFTIYLLCVLGLLQLYGLNTFIWLVDSDLGLRILSAAGALLVTIVLAVCVWEGVNGSLQAHLERLQREAQMAKSARLRTLLPLLRSTLMITIAIVAGLTILSEIGINIAPLLAGAGIVGVAIGFGSQKLVQDFITGIFLLLENAMQVGDTVTVSGLSGTVEALSVRTIRLRAGDGSVHIIPFSSVTSVTNVNRGLGNAAVNVTVSYDEDTDRVCDELKTIVAGMRTDPDLSAKMLSDLQLWGVDAVTGGSVTIAGQVVCTDSGRWAVQREFNRRMKRRFQELGIRVFNPLQTISVSASFPPPTQPPAQSAAQSAVGDAVGALPAPAEGGQGHAQAAD